MIYKNCPCKAQRYAASCGEGCSLIVGYHGLTSAQVHAAAEALGEYQDANRCEFPVTRVLYVEIPDERPECIHCHGNGQIYDENIIGDPIAYSCAACNGGGHQ